MRLEADVLGEQAAGGIDGGVAEVHGELCAGEPRFNRAQKRKSRHRELARNDHIELQGEQGAEQEPERPSDERASPHEPHQRQVDQSGEAGFTEKSQTPNAGRRLIWAVGVWRFGVLHRRGGGRRRRSGEGEERVEQRLFGLEDDAIEIRRTGELRAPADAFGKKEGGGGRGGGRAAGGGEGEGGVELVAPRAVLAAGRHGGRKSIEDKIFARRVWSAASSVCSAARRSAGSAARASSQVAGTVPSAGAARDFSTRTVLSARRVKLEAGDLCARRQLAEQAIAIGAVDDGRGGEDGGIDGVNRIGAGDAGIDGGVRAEAELQGEGARKGC